MPTVDSIARQISLTADVSSRIFRNDMEAARESPLIQGPINTANDMIRSGFGLRSNITEMLGNYAQERENFTDEFDRTISSLRDSSDRARETVQQREDEQIATRRRAQETEHDRRESAELFAEAARQRAQENQRTDQARADELAAENLERVRNDIAEQSDNTERYNEALREQIQNADESRQQRTEQIEAANNTRVQSQREQLERFAERYLTNENVERQNQNAAQIQNVVQNLNLTRDENSNAALANVRNLVNRVDAAVNYFNQNRDVSDRMNALAANFNRLREDIQNLNGEENSEAVNRIAERLNRSVELANSQRENLFTNVAAYVNQERIEPTESLYALQLNQTALHAGQINWRFLNMFT